MRLFSKKKRDKEIDELMIKASAEESGILLHTPDTLTPDEINAPQKSKSVSNESPFEALKNKLTGNSQPINNDRQEESNTPSFKINTALFNDEPQTEEIEEPYTISESFHIKDDFLVYNSLISSQEKIPLENNDSHFLDKNISEDILSEFNKLSTAKVPEYPAEVLTTEKIYVAENDTEETEEISVLQMCMPFILDGTDENFSLEQKPVYTLDSVEKILGLEEKQDTEKQENQQAHDESFVETLDSTIIFDAIGKNEEIKKTQEHLPDISDIDPLQKAKPFDTDDITLTRTMPVYLPNEVTEGKHNIDISSEIFQKKETSTYFDDNRYIDPDADFTVKDEYKNKSDGKKIRVKLLKERRSRFLKLIGSIAITLFLLIFAIPAIYENGEIYKTGLSIVHSTALLLCVALNYDVFLSLKTLFTKRVEAKVSIAFSVIACIFAAIVSFVNNTASNVIHGLALMSSCSLTFKAYFEFLKSNYMYKNFCLVSGKKQKHGITLINDAPTTFAMAHKAIEGEALITAPVKTTFIRNFMRNSTIDRDLGGRAGILFLISLITSIVFGITVGFYHKNFVSGVLTFSAVSVICAPLTLCCPNILPLHNAAKRLNGYSAMITGVNSACKIEESNVLVVDCKDLFPVGSIKLHDLKILSENNLEETIAIATAITEIIGSPIYNVFRSIMDTNKDVAVPKADSIKYEERLGITGWVGDKRVFIGNRTLMLAHEIPVPEAETDKDILRKGFFPVYLACDGRVCALLSLSYNPDKAIAKELRRVTGTGVTVLVSNCDQNLSSEMLCDYFELYEDSIQIMSGSGVHMYNNATATVKEMDTGAVLKKGAAGLAAIVTSAIKIKKSNDLLNAAHIISIALGISAFSYSFFTTSSLTISILNILAFQLICFIVSMISYLFTKP